MSFRILLVTLLALTAFAGGSHCAGAADALPNPSFELLDPETALPAQWRAWAKGTTAAYSLTRAHAGVASLLLTDASPTAGHGVRSEQVAAAAGKRYRASGYVFIEDLPAGSFSIYIEFWNASGSRLTNYSAATADKGKWVKLDVEATAPAGATAATVLCYGSSATVGTAYFDDLSLLPAAAKSEVMGR